VHCSLPKLNSEIAACMECRLSRKRRNAVPGEGPADTKIMFVGEAPGESEDLQGRPFVGAAGKLLNGLLASINLRREDVFITNVVKCRPPGNRPPRADEIEACSKFLSRQMAVVNPKFVCTLGNFALRSLVGKELSITKVHGKKQSRHGRIFVPMYHPAAALYLFRLRETMMKDFRRLAELLRQQ